MLSTSGLTRARSTAFALAVVIWVSLFGVYSASAQGTWTVNVQVGQPQITFDPATYSGNCNTARPNLSINGNVWGTCLGDTIKWVAMKGGQTAANDKIVVFSEDGIFTSQPPDTVTDTGTGQASAVVTGGNSTVRYYIAVLDGSTWHTQDPRIVMGSGTSFTIAAVEQWFSALPPRLQEGFIKSLIGLENKPAHQPKGKQP